jgi:hypothetical protein
LIPRSRARKTPLPSRRTRFPSGRATPPGVGWMNLGACNVCAADGLRIRNFFCMISASSSQRAAAAGPQSFAVRSTPARRRSFS